MVSKNERQRYTPDLKWWQKTVVYQIYPRSFKDSNGDGVGDLKGIKSKLDHFTYLGVGAIWISPFYPSPMRDFGYDTTSQVGVDPIFGTLDDFDALLKAAHDKGIRVMIDFVPGYTSTDHPWFQKSVNRTPPYDDYYIWDDGLKLDNGSTIRPSNWVSPFGDSSWEWNAERRQYFYHAFTRTQPNLNHRNAHVREDLKKVIKFWMERGVDGMRVDAVPNMMVSSDHHKDEPLSGEPGAKPVFIHFTGMGSSSITGLREVKGIIAPRLPEGYNGSFDLPKAYKWEGRYYIPTQTQNQPEIGPIMKEWREILDSYDDSDGDTDHSKFMVAEVYDPPAVRNRYFDYGADMPFNFDLVLKLNGAFHPEPCDAVCIRDIVKVEYDTLPEGKWANFVLSNHDNRRASSRIGPLYADALHVMLLTLRGTPTTYYGEEIAMEDITLTFNETKDPWGITYGPDHYMEVSRDPARSPMQWDSSNTNAGFSNASAKPWLPVNPNYRTVNVETEKNSTNVTTIHMYRDLVQLRSEPSLQYGLIEFGYADTNVMSYLRSAVDHPPFLVVINFGNVTVTQDFSRSPVDKSQGQVKVATSAAVNEERFVKGYNKSLASLTLKPGDGVVFQL